MRSIIAYWERSLMVSKLLSDFSPQKMIKSCRFGWLLWRSTSQELSETRFLIVQTPTHTIGARMFFPLTERMWANRKRTWRSGPTNVDPINEKSLCRYCNHGLNGNQHSFRAQKDMRTVKSNCIYDMLVDLSSKLQIELTMSSLGSHRCVEK